MLQKSILQSASNKVLPKVLLPSASRSLILPTNSSSSSSSSTSSTSSTFSSTSSTPSIQHSIANQLLFKQASSTSSFQSSSFSTQSTPSLPSLSPEALGFSGYPASRVSVLPNGIRVITENSSTHSGTASVGVFINTGSRYETAKNNGVAHFLEHLSFKGTPTRSRYTLETEIENMGAHLNAFTAREMTVYYMRLLAHDIGHGIAVMSDMLLYSKLEKYAIERERSVILREAEEVAKVPEEVVFDNLHLAVYPDHGLGFPILGSEENIMTLQQSDIKEYINTHYTGDRMIVAAAGCVDHDSLVEHVINRFAKIPTTFTPSSLTSTKVNPFWNRVKPRFEPRHARLHLDDDDRVDGVNFAIAYPAPDWNSPDVLPIMVLQGALGAWDYRNTGGHNAPSRLIQRVASKQLARSINTYHTPYLDAGLFGIYASTEVDQARELMQVMSEELRAVCETEGTLTQESIELAKTQIKNGLLQGMESTSGLCEEIGRHMLVYGRRIHPMEMIARIDSVDLPAVINVARKYLLDRVPGCSIYGILTDAPNQEEIAKCFYLDSSKIRL